MWAFCKAKHLELPIPFVFCNTASDFRRLKFSDMVVLIDTNNEAMLHSYRERVGCSVARKKDTWVDNGFCFFLLSSLRIKGTNLRKVWEFSASPRVRPFRVLTHLLKATTKLVSFVVQRWIWWPTSASLILPFRLARRNDTWVDDNQTVLVVSTTLGSIILVARRFFFV